jgi:ubiquinone/menaquinone biosynthesis C-methylase UbiE
MMARKTQQTYIKGLRFDWLTRFYDPVIKLFFNEDKLREQFIFLMNLKGDETILDLGCGTGTLSIMLKKKYPDLLITGIDGDNYMITRARKKAEINGVDITFTHAFAQQLPFEYGTFDTVVSSLVFHHLPTEIKRAALTEIHRVLVPNGRLFIADWGQPASRSERLQFYLIQLLDGFETTSDTVSGKLPEFIRNEFGAVDEIMRVKTIFGVLSVYATGLNQS